MDKLMSSALSVGSRDTDLDAVIKYNKENGNIVPTEESSTDVAVPKNVSNKEKRDYVLFTNRFSKYLFTNENHVNDLEKLPDYISNVEIDYINRGNVESRVTVDKRYSRNHLEYRPIRKKSLSVIDDYFKEINKGRSKDNLAVYYSIDKRHSFVCYNAENNLKGYANYLRLLMHLQYGQNINELVDIRKYRWSNYILFDIGYIPYYIVPSYMQNNNEITNILRELCVKCGVNVYEYPARSFLSSWKGSYNDWWIYREDLVKISEYVSSDEFITERVDSLCRKESARYNKLYPDTKVNFTIGDYFGNTFYDTLVALDNYAESRSKVLQSMGINDVFTTRYLDGYYDSNNGKFDDDLVYAYLRASLFCYSKDANDYDENGTCRPTVENISIYEFIRSLAILYGYELPSFEFNPKLNYGATGDYSIYLTR